MHHKFSVMHTLSNLVVVAVWFANIVSELSLHLQIKVNVSRHCPQNYSTGLLDSGKFFVCEDSGRLGYCTVSLGKYSGTSFPLPSFSCMYRLPYLVPKLAPYK
jgi:hypothetical protein